MDRFFSRSDGCSIASRSLLFGDIVACVAGSRQKASVRNSKPMWSTQPSFILRSMAIGARIWMPVDSKPSIIGGLLRLVDDALQVCVVFSSITFGPVCCPVCIGGGPGSPALTRAGESRRAGGNRAMVGWGGVLSVHMHDYSAYLGWKRGCSSSPLPTMCPWGKYLCDDGTMYAKMA